MLLTKDEENTERRMREVLEAEADLVEDSLQRQRRELELENSWNLLRLKKEKEAEEDMREELLKKEVKLLEELKRAGEEKAAKDRENDELREKLAEMKTRMDHMLTAQKASEAIRQKDAEKVRLQKEVRELRRTREEKKLREVEEATRKRKEIEKEIREKQSRLAKDGGITRERLRDHEEEDTLSSTNLNRSQSHSSPNIAQMLEEEDRKALARSNVPVPVFDRTSKPVDSLARARNFQPVLGTARKKGLTGLKNLGNTCYMNSVLQCLCNFTYPSQYFMDNKFRADMNKHSETRGEVATEYAALVRALWSGQYKCIAPNDVKRVIGRHREVFRGSAQQDAHEFMLFLMEWLHNDVNEVGRKVKLPEKDFDRLPESEGADAAWEHEKTADKSFIRETFYGQRKSSVRCLTCGYESVKYEAFFELSVQLPEGTGRCSVRDCIEKLLAPETVNNWACPKCKVKRDSRKKLDIVKFPLILTIHLSRFYQDFDMHRKKQNYVDFELSKFDIGRYATVAGGRKNRYRDYDLYGVVNHFGTMEGGHYTAYCYSQVYKKWHKYDDSEVTHMDPSSVKTAAAYMLFYSALN